MASIIRSPGRTRKNCITISLICILATLSSCRKDEEIKTPPPPVEVNVISVKPKTIPVDTDFVAQVESAHQVEIVARVNGFLEKILYKEGALVQKGQPMFLMDQKPFLAQVEAARGALASNQAQLATAQANLNRVRPLVKLDAASKSDLDNALGSVKSAEAAVHTATAQLEKAELNLSYTEITSPVKGVSGEAKIREGAYLSVGSGSNLSYVAQIDPIWVTFSISQNQLAQRRDQLAKGIIIAPENNEYTVEVHLSDKTIFPHSGTLEFVDPTFNQKTGTFQIKAELANPEATLRPGMFVKAVLKGIQRPNALAVPQRSVQQTSNGHILFIVGEEETVEVRPVIVGPWAGQDWIIEKGLNAGERVITDGFMHIRPGMKVTPVESENTPPTQAANK